MCARFVCACELVYARCDCFKAMHARACVCVLMHKTYSHYAFCEAMHVCVRVCFLGFYKAHAHGDCCEVMHVCAFLCVLVHKVLAQGDCCEAVHACVGVYVYRFVQGACSQ